MTSDELRYELDVDRAATTLTDERLAGLERRLASIMRSRSYRLALQIYRLRSVVPKRRR